MRKLAGFWQHLAGRSGSTPSRHRRTTEGGTRGLWAGSNSPAMPGSRAASPKVASRNSVSGVVRPRPEMRLLPLLRQIQALARARQERAINQSSCLPGNAGKRSRAPSGPRPGRMRRREKPQTYLASGRDRSILPLCLHSIALRPAGVGRAQIRVEYPSKALQVSEEFAGVNHEGVIRNQKSLKVRQRCVRPRPGGHWQAMGRSVVPSWRRT